jgi:peptide/nickel transport system substrate-binding protein
MQLDEGSYVILFQQVETGALRKNVDGFIIGPTFDSNLYKNVVKK